jgi:hypothetical protein
MVLYGVINVLIYYYYTSLPVLRILVQFFKHGRMCLRYHIMVSILSFLSVLFEILQNGIYTVVSVRLSMLKNVIYSICYLFCVASFQTSSAD